MRLTPGEIHAVIIGAAETFCPWPPRIPYQYEYREAILQEYHYYMAGRASGFITLMLFLTALAKLVKELLL